MLATDAGLRLQIATGTASHLRRFGEWGGGFWLPECAYEPGLERDLADHGVRAFCVDQTAVPRLRSPAAGGDRGRPGGRADRLADGGAGLERQRGLPGPRHLPRLPPAHRARPQALEQRRRPLRPRGGAGAGPRARARLRRARREPSGRRAGCSAARSTPSCSATGGTRGRPGWPRSWRRRRARGSSWSRSARGWSAPSLSRPTWRPPPGAAARTCPPGTRPGWATWRSPPAELSCERSPPRPVTRAHGRRWSAPPASCSRCRRATGRSWPPASWPATTRGERLQAHSADLDAALGALADSAAVPEPALRHLAPDLDLAALTSP